MHLVDATSLGHVHILNFFKKTLNIVAEARRASHSEIPQKPFMFLSR